MVIRAQTPRSTPDEYLRADRGAEIKSEYIDGHVVAMSGGSRDNLRIKVDLTWIVRDELEDSTCEVFDSDLRIRVDRQRYTHPDLTVVCGESRFEDTGAGEAGRA